jgi:hypothetical protein
MLKIKSEIVGIPCSFAAPTRGNATLTSQHSLSGGNISEHEKWEKEGGMEYALRKGKSSLAGSSGRDSNKNKRGSPAAPKGK